MKLTKLFSEFFENEKAGGIVLVLATIVSLALANSEIAHSYIGFWNQPLGSHSLTDWINDGLMAIFFLLIGLELEREIYLGELSELRTASLPIFGALGGMIVPAAIFLLFNFGSAAQSGAGIPMATDIAFAVGILSLLGSRVPTSLKVFLTALAVIDDLGAILVIAIFYTKGIVVQNLLISVGIWLILFIIGKLKVYNLIPYLIGGAVMWYFMLHSGVHATVTGVMLAFAIPFGNGHEKSTSHLLQHFLHMPVAFIILPLFALANTCIPVGNDWQDHLVSLSGLGIMIGLIVGKPLGIWLFSFLASKLNICNLPSDLRWKDILAVGMLGGIGFTMSIFIALLAFSDGGMINQSKIAVLAASLISGTLGFIFLKIQLGKRNSED